MSILNGEPVEALPKPRAGVACEQCGGLAFVLEGHRDRELLVCAVCGEPAPAGLADEQAARDEIVKAALERRQQEAGRQRQAEERRDHEQAERQRQAEAAAARGQRFELQASPLTDKYVVSFRAVIALPLDVFPRIAAAITQRESALGDTWLSSFRADPAYREVIKFRRLVEADQTALVEAARDAEAARAKLDRMLREGGDHEDTCARDVGKVLARAATVRERLTAREGLLADAEKAAREAYTRHLERCEEEATMAQERLTVAAQERFLARGLLGLEAWLVEALLHKNLTAAPAHRRPLRKPLAFEAAPA
jgi:hypothetical protein